MVVQISFISIKKKRKRNAKCHKNKHHELSKSYVPLQQNFTDPNVSQVITRMTLWHSHVCNLKIQRCTERVSDTTVTCAVIAGASLLNRQHKHIVNVKQTHADEIESTDVVENELLLACSCVTGFQIGTMFIRHWIPNWH